MRKWDLLKSDGTSARFPHLYHDVTQTELQGRLSMDDISK